MTAHRMTLVCRSKREALDPEQLFRDMSTHGFSLARIERKTYPEVAIECDHVASRDDGKLEPGEEEWVFGR